MTARTNHANELEGREVDVHKYKISPFFLFGKI